MTWVRVEPISHDQGRQKQFIFNHLFTSTLLVLSFTAFIFLFTRSFNHQTIGLLMHLYLTISYFQVNFISFLTEQSTPKLAVSINLQHVGKSAVVRTDHWAGDVPVSVHELTVASSGMRLPLHEYTIELPARNWPLISAGTVIALT